MPVTIRILQAGAASAHPYTIAFVANPVLKDRSGSIATDPILSNQAGFDACVTFAVDCLYGRLAGQTENFLADPAIGTNIRIVSIFETGLAVTDANSLVEESDFGQMISPRRDQYLPYLLRHSIHADVAYAISGSTRYSRASAYGTTDNTAGAGTPFVLDGVTRMHWHFPLIPGAVAMHVTANSLTPAHEFGHAASSYSSGFVTDLYVPNTAVNFNVRIGPPIPLLFATYDGTAYPSDPTRDGLGYGNWNSYHPGLVNTAAPALMDNYTTQANPLVCRHDAITRAYLRDRLIAKIGRI